MYHPSVKPSNGRPAKRSRRQWRELLMRWREGELLTRRSPSIRPVTRLSTPLSSVQVKAKTLPRQSISLGSPALESKSDILLERDMVGSVAVCHAFITINIFIICVNIS